MIKIDWGFALTVAGVVLGIAGLLVPWLVGTRNRYIFSWKRVRTSIEELHEQIRLKGFEPDIIVAFAKGGFIIADLLSRGFSKYVPICALATRRVLQDGRRKVELDASFLNPEGLSGKRILIVDDIVQTGASLQRVVEFLCDQRGFPRADLATAVVAVPKGAVLFQPDFFVLRIEFGERRPRFPWGEIALD